MCDAVVVTLNSELIRRNAFNKKVGAEALNVMRSKCSCARIFPGKIRFGFKYQQESTSLMINMYMQTEFCTLFCRIE